MSVPLPRGPEVRTRQQIVVEYLRNLILQGTLAPGTRLQPEAIARHLGVSRMPVREALRQLAVEQFVVFQPHRGVYVAEVSADEAEELYVVRIALEGYAARIAAPRLTPEVIAELRQRLAEMAARLREGELVEFLAADRAFHRAIYQATGRPGLVARIEQLWDSCSRVARLSLAMPVWRERALAAHRQILAAAEQRDPAALEQAVREHTEVSARMSIDYLRAMEAARDGSKLPFPSPGGERGAVAAGN